MEEQASQEQASQEQKVDEIEQGFNDIGKKLFALSKLFEENDSGNDNEKDFYSGTGLILQGIYDEVFDLLDKFRDVDVA